MAVGHSAGGHLVLWLATRGLALDLVVPVAGVCDLVRADELGLGSGAVAALLGGHPVTDADPATLHDGPPGPRVVLVHGAADDTVPLELSQRFVARHPWAELVTVPGTGHFEFLDPREPAWQVLTSVIATGQTGA